MKTQTEHVKTITTVPTPFLNDWTIAPHAWWGRCPACGDPAVFCGTRPGQVTVACCAPRSRGCWWAT